MRKIKNYPFLITFSNYLVTSDAAEVAKKVPTEPVYCEFLED